MVGDGPARWELSIEAGRITFRPHWAWVVGTFGLARLRRNLTFDASSTSILVASTRRKKVFTAASNDGSRKRDFLDAVDGMDEDIALALREAGFDVRERP